MVVPALPAGDWGVWRKRSCRGRTPLLVVRPAFPDAGAAWEPVVPYTKILVPLDGSSLAAQVLAYTRNLAAATGAGLLQPRPCFRD